jgi:hypothetical protein
LILWDSEYGVDYNQLLALVKYLLDLVKQIHWITSVAFNAMVGGQQLTFPGRLTAVLEKRGDRYLIVQSHFSFPAAGQEEGEAFPDS